MVQTRREQSSVRELESKISQQEELIGSYEAKVSKAQATSDELERVKSILTATAEALQKLQDEFDAMKSDLDKQSRKANTADKYMRKLQNASIIERERDMLKFSLEEMRNQLSSQDKLHLDNRALLKTNDEVSRVLAQIERENEDLRITNKQLRLNGEDLAQQLKLWEERKTQDQDTDKESVPGSPTALDVLENELSISSLQTHQMYAKFPL